MTINQVIQDLIDRRNMARDDGEVARWCSEVDNGFLRQVELSHEMVRYTPADYEALLLFPAPYDSAYYFYCAAQIYMMTRQYSDYQNCMAQYNSLRDSYALERVRYADAHRYDEEVDTDGES